MIISNRPTAIDLFCGAGGMSLGLEGSGFNVVAGVEADPIHALVHHFNFPYSATICQDINNLSGQLILDAVKEKGYSTEIDLISFEPPCQSFSLMGKREADDPRNDLAFAAQKIILEIKPKYFIFENVPGLLSGNPKKILTKLLDIFEENNYSIVKPVAVLNAVEFGVAQKRKRVIILGYRKGMKKPFYPIPTHGDKLLPFVTVEEAIGDLADIDCYINTDQGINFEEVLSWKQYFAMRSLDEFSFCHKRKKDKLLWGHLGTKHSSKIEFRFAATIPGTQDNISKFLKLAADGQCNTLRAGSHAGKGAFTSPRPIHFKQPRCITIREAARLHSYPDWFQFNRTIWHGMREIGNSVPPLMAKKIGDEIIKQLCGNDALFKIDECIEMNDEILDYNARKACSYWAVNFDNIPKRKRGFK